MANAVNAVSAYAKAKLATAGARSIEADAIEKINGELARAAKDVRRNYPAFVAALSRNAGLWTILASDVAHRENKLPVELRSKIWSLAGFVRKQTQKLLNGDVEPDVSILTEINGNIIIGLQANQAKSQP